MVRLTKIASEKRLVKADDLSGQLPVFNEQLYSAKLKEPTTVWRWLTVNRLLLA